MSKLGRWRRGDEDPGADTQHGYRLEHSRVAVGMDGQKAVIDDMPEPVGEEDLVEHAMESRPPGVEEGARTHISTAGWVVAAAAAAAAVVTRTGCDVVHLEEVAAVEVRCWH
jgi:hypothetical protein